MTQGAPLKPFDNSDASSVDTKIESESSKTSDDRFERVHSLWFEDGNVVIIADKTAFRIHRSILRRHSDIITDHLEMNYRRRDDADEDYVVVHVPDSAKSFKGLLRLLYPGPSE